VLLEAIQRQLPAQPPGVYVYKNFGQNLVTLVVQTITIPFMVHLLLLAQQCTQH